MKLRIHEQRDGSIAVVTLSRRNLLALLHKLEMPGSARALITAYDCPDGWELVVRSEPDDEHYGVRVEPPGPLHPASEMSVNQAVTEDDDGRLKNRIELDWSGGAPSSRR